MLETEYDVELQEIKNERKIIRKAANLNSLTLVVFLILSNLLAIGSTLVVKLFKDVLIEKYYVAIYDYIGYALMYFVALPVSILLINKKNGFKLRNFFSKPSVSKKEIFKWTLIGYGVTMAVNLIFNTLFVIIQSFGVKMSVPEMPASNSWISILLSFVFVAFLAPISEEIIFRGSILGNTAKCGEWFAIVMSGVFFGLTHANYQQIFFAVAMGIIAGYITIRAHSIVPSVALHITMNFLSTVQLALVNGMDSRLLDTETSSDLLQKLLIKNLPLLIPMMLLSLLCFTLAVLGTIFFFVEIAKRKKQPKLNNRCNKVSASDKLFIYITSPWTVALILLLLFMTARNMVGF